MSERDYYDKDRSRYSPYHGEQRERREYRDSHANSRHPRDNRDPRENRDLRYSREQDRYRNSRDNWSPRRRSPPRDSREYSRYSDERRYKESGRERERRSPPPDRADYNSRSYSNRSPPRPTSPSSRYDRIAPLLAQAKRPLTPQQQKIEEMDKQFYQMQSEERVTEDKIFDIELDIKNSYFALSQAKLSEDIAHAKLEEIRKRIQMLS